jgi:ketosteroid isomerase-like protein
MSQENVERLRQAYDAVNQGDFEPFLAGAHPDLEYRANLQAVMGESGTYRGREGLAEYVKDLRSVWSSWRWILKEVSTLDEAHVLAVIDWEGVGLRSSVPVTVHAVVMFTFQDGLVIRAEDHLTRQAALEAVGLEE